MSIELETLKHYIAQCDPSKPLGPDDSRYVAFDEGTPVRGQPGENCVDQLYRTIFLSESDAPTTQLFSGFPGTGKTTELYRLQRMFDGERKDLPTEVIHLDFTSHYVRSSAPLETTDILRSAAFALDAAAILAEQQADAPLVELHEAPTKYPKAFANESFLRRLFDQIVPSIALKNVTFEAFGLKLMAEIRTTPTIHDAASSIASGRFSEFAAEAQEYMRRAVKRIKTARRVERVVLIADGLEKMAAVREEEQESMTSSVARVFAEQADLLRLPCHVIYTFPLWLRYSEPNFGAQYSASPQVLPMVKVVEPNGEPYEPGLKKLAVLLSTERLDLSRVFGSVTAPALRRLLRASGGYPRDLLVNTRSLLMKARVWPVTEADVERIVQDVVANNALAIRDRDLPMLHEVAGNSRAPIQDSVKIQQFGRLIEQRMVLAYRNGVKGLPEWYRPHPLMMETYRYKEYKP